MPDAVIAVENLSKRYLIGHTTELEWNSTLREAVVHKVRGFARKAGSVVRGQHLVHGDEIEEFWALKDVSFEVKQGEVLGIIGRNGAGKSTLLKILSRITEPTEGRALLRGRVSSLLEVGTGFHPELTGRENIFLNGAILGMAQWEIRKKFDEIVAFAEVEKFLDTPVKRFSSGMYVRLAFAVAAHLEPEILIVDEVLAVGDSEFQKKCLGKMRDVARESRTVLFVSHNMGAVRTLTQRCILLERGSIVQSGNTEDVVTSYFRQSIEAKRAVTKSNSLQFFRRSPVKHGAPAEIIAIDTVGSDQSASDLPALKLGERLTIRVHLMVHKPLDAADFGLTIRTPQGDVVVSLQCSDKNQTLSLEPGQRILEITFGDLSLAPGDYFLDAGIDPMIDSYSCDSIYDYPLLSIVNDGQIIHVLNRSWGVIQCQDVQWTIS